MINPTLALIERMQQGRLHDPFELLGAHPQPKGWQVRAWSPTATELSLQGLHNMTRIGDSACFSVDLSEKQYATLPRHYRLDWREADGSTHSMVSPYSFDPLLGALDLHLFAEGHHWQIYQHMGANFKQVDGVEGVQFAVWAPSAERVSVIGDFNGWHGLRHPMRCRGSSGVWELFIPGLQPGDNYKFEIRNNQNGSVFTKTDPYAKAMELRPKTASIICNSDFAWHDQAG